MYAYVFLELSNVTAFFAIFLLNSVEFVHGTIDTNFSPGNYFNFSCRRRKNQLYKRLYKQLYKQLYKRLYNRLYKQLYKRLYNQLYEYEFIPNFLIKQRKVGIIHSI